MKKLKLKFVMFAFVLGSALAMSFTLMEKENKETTEVKGAILEEATVGSTFTYYVTGEQTVGAQIFYLVSLTDPGCSGSGKPCEVISNQAADSNNRIPQNAVESVESQRSSY